MQSGNPSVPDQYELIELAPKIFKNIRRIHNIDDYMVKSIFSIINLKELDISISSGKGGSFFIKPIHGGRMLIKSITKPEYEIIQDFLPDYYCYLLMNPNTYLCPILGVYKLKLQKNNQVPPIIFILMRNVLNMDPSDIGPDDKIYTFDLKGSVHGRRTLKDPLEILNFEENYKHHKNLILKDIDFFQSFRKLDITNIQSERIMSQINEDTQFLSDHNFMDYSLLLYVVMKPYKDVVSNLHHDPHSKDNDSNRFMSVDKQAPTAGREISLMDVQRSTMTAGKTKDLKRLERASKYANMHKKEIGNDDSQALYTNVVRFSDVIEHEPLQKHNFSKDDARDLLGNTLFLSEIAFKPKPNKFVAQTGYKDNQPTLPVMIFKEKVKNKLRIYKIADVNDISNMKSIDFEEQQRIALLHQTQENNKFGSILDNNDEKDDSRDSSNFDEFFANKNDMSSSVGLYDSNYGIARPSARFFGRETMSGNNAGINRSSIINFKNMSRNKSRLNNLPSTTKPKQSKSPSKDTYEDALQKKLAEIDALLEKEMNKNRQNEKDNNIIEVTDEDDESQNSSIDVPWQNISNTDVIEQIIFDPKLGMIKREIHFGIIDYITTFTLRKKIEEKIKGVTQDDPS